MKHKEFIIIRPIIKVITIGNGNNGNDLKWAINECAVIIVVILLMQK